MNIKKSQILMVTGSLLLLTLFFVPIWKITLEAPQYPEAIGMNIWINKITDLKPNDLQNINLMNHYIGMKEIPEFIPEFKYFPYILLTLSFLGICVAIHKKRNLYLIWSISIFALCILGMYDFWLWGYNYGHNLSETAAIQFSDEFGKTIAYQPPLIGRKTILNFQATSFPTYGSYIIITSILLSISAFLFETKKEILPEIEKVKKNNPILKFTSITILIMLLSSCYISEKEIVYGEDSCHYCKMHIVDKQYASELVTKKGKVYVFDAMECMLNEIKNSNINKYELFLTNTYDSPSILFDAKECFYIISDKHPSPMGANLTTFSTKKLASKALGNGLVYNWSELKLLFKISE